MRSAPLKEIFGTLRFRLTLWNTAVVLLTVVVTLVGVREGLRRIQAKRQQEFLREECLEVQHQIEQGYPRWERIYEELTEKVESHKARRMCVQVFDVAGKLQWSSTPKPETAWAERLFEDGGRVIAADDYRLLETPLHHPAVTLRVGVTTERADNDLARFTEAMLVVGALLLLVAPVGGYWLAGRATRPLKRIIDTTARLHPADLAERLPVRGSNDELDRLSETINRLLDRIASHLEQNREFTANAAHELRSPLTAIQNSLEVALNADRSPSEYQETLTEMLEECDHLRSLVNQLLLLAEADAGRLPLPGKSVPLDQVVQRSLDMFQGVAENAGVQLQATRLEPVHIRGDDHRLRQVVNNLIDNAIKFTSSPGKVRVDLRLDTARNEAVLVVSDTGSGIAPDDLPHIFERFYRGDKSRRREQHAWGMGLGLSICRSLIAAHGGRIDVASTLGSGTDFTVRLPACPPPERSADRRETAHIA